MAETRWQIIRDDAFRPTTAMYRIADALSTERRPKITLEQFLVLPSDDPLEIQTVEKVAAEQNIELRRK